MKLFVRRGEELSKGGIYLPLPGGLQPFFVFALGTFLVLLHWLYLYGIEFYFNDFNYR